MDLGAGGGFPFALSLSVEDPPLTACRNRSTSVFARCESLCFCSLSLCICLRKRLRLP